MNQPYWRGVLTGIIVGAGAALLLAPKRGEELRDELLESADDWKDKAVRSAHDLTERGSGALGEVKQTASEVSASVKDAAQDKLENAKTVVAEKRDEVAHKMDEVTHKNDADVSHNDVSHNEVEVGAAMAAALGDDEMTAQAENGEVQNVAGDDIAPSPAVREASEQTLDEIQTQSPDSNTAPEEAQAAQAQPLEDKIAAAVEVARENNDESTSDESTSDESTSDESTSDESTSDELNIEAAVEEVTDKVEEVKEVVADKASETADAAAEAINDEDDKTPDAVVDAPENDAPKSHSNAKRRGKNRRKRSPNT